MKLSKKLSQEIKDQSHIFAIYWKMKKFIFIIFKRRYRNIAMNNFLYSKKIGTYRIVNLSGLILSYIGYFIYKLNLSKNFKFISCDATPFLENERQYYKNHFLCIYMCIEMINFSINKEIGLFHIFSGGKSRSNMLFAESKLRKNVMEGMLNWQNTPAQLELNQDSGYHLMIVLIFCHVFN